MIVVRVRRRDGLEKMSQQQKNKKTKKVAIDCIALSMARLFY
jgi:hypothetical protein